MSYKQEFYDLLNHSNLSLDLSETPFTLLFVYPGIGVGKVYEDLAGCTKQLCQLSSTQDKADSLGVQIAALSSVETMTESLMTSYFPIGSVSSKSIPSDLLVEKNTQSFFVRAAYLLLPDGQIQRWIDPDGIRMIDEGFHRVEQVYLKYVKEITQDPISDKKLTDCIISALATGADSLGILEMELTRNFILKRLTRHDTEIETNYMMSMNNTEHTIFPTIYAQNVLCQERWIVMDKLNNLKKYSTPKLVERLSRFYQSTLAEVAVDLNYHLYQRFVTILSSEEFETTRSMINLSKVEVLKQRISLGGRKTATIEKMLDDVNAQLTSFQTPFVSRIHGDVHWPNVLENEQREMILIDPRLTWDKLFSIDGHFDPTYDFATLLHSSILESLGTNEIIESEKGELIASSRLIEIAEQLESELLVSIADHLPLLMDDLFFLCKLRIFCANATLGWLKYPQFVCKREQWNYYFGLTLYWLDRAIKN